MAKKPVPTLYRTEIGKSGLKWSQYGYVSEEFLLQLRGSRGVKVFREMSDNDAIVGATQYALTQILREVRWGVKPADPEKKVEDDPDAQFLEKNMRSMTHSWGDFISEIMTMFTYGWAWFEQIYKLDGEHAMWKKFAPRSQASLERWEMQDNGEVTGMWQRAAPNYQLAFIPLRKSIHFVTTSRYSNPEGHSILRNAYRPWYFKKNLEEIEAIGIERDLVGIPVINLPEGMKIEDPSEENETAIKWAKDIVTNLRNDEQAGLVLPHGWEFKLTSSPGTKQIDVNQVVLRYSKEIAITILAQFIMLGMERTGSFALAKELMDLFFLSLEAFADAIATTINRQAVALLFKLNGVVDRPLPYIVHTPVRRQMIRDMAYYISSLINVEALELEEDLKSYLKQYARLTQYSEAKS